MRRAVLFGPGRRDMRRAVVIVAVLAFLAAAAPAAAETWTVQQQRGPAAVVQHDEEAGTLSPSVTRDGTTVLEPSPLGIVTAEADLSSGLRFLGRSDRRVNERYETTVGKELDRRARMTESRFELAGAGGARLDVVVRASDDGVAYRYVVPEDRGAVLREASAFTVPAGATAWLGRHRRDYENPFIEYTAAGAPAAEFMIPALFEVGGSYLLLAESGLDGGYSGSRLVHEEGTGTYRIELWHEQVQLDGAPRGAP